MKDLRITLDIKDIQSQITIPVKVGDTSCKLYIALTENGEPYKVHENSFGVFTGKKGDGNPILNNCLVEDGVICYAFTPQTVAAPGVLECEVRIYDEDGGTLTTPRFTIIVDERVVKDSEVTSSSEFAFLDDVVKEEETRKKNEKERIENFNNFSNVINETRIQNELVNTKLDDVITPIALSPITIYEKKYINANGEVLDHPENRLKLVKIEPSTNYYVGNLNEGRNCTIFLDDKKELICNYTSLYPRYEIVITTPDNAHYMLYWAQDGYDDDLIIEESLYNTYGKVRGVLSENMSTDDFVKVDSIIDIESTTFKKKYMVYNMHNPKTDTEGYYCNYSNGAISPNANYCYTEKIAVEPNQVLKFTTEQGEYFNCRMVTEYDIDGTCLGGVQNVWEYTQHDNVAFIVVSLDMTKHRNAMIADASAKGYMPYNDGEYLNEKYLFKDENITDAATIKNSATSSLTIDTFPQYLKTAQSLTFKGKFSGFQNLKIGKGYNTYRGHWFEIDNTKIVHHKYETNDIIVTSISHNLDIADYLSVMIDIDGNNAVLSLNSRGGTFTHTFNFECECCGVPFVTSGTSMSNVIFSATSKSFNRDVWMFGDSYFGVNGIRTIGQLKNLGVFDDVLIDGLAGQNSIGAFTELQKALKYGTPKYIVWCLGMNDDDNTHQSYLGEVESLCRAKGIELIMATIPTTPTRTKEVVSNYVRNSGHRYIDFYNAVGANASGEWYQGYLGEDDVHPTELGAKALAVQILIDFPEILKNHDISDEIYHDQILEEVNKKLNSDGGTVTGDYYKDGNVFIHEGNLEKIEPKINEVLESGQYINTNNLEKIEPKITEVFANEVFANESFVESASGNPVVLKDSAKQRFKNLKVFGKTTQNTTTGKNLYDISTIKNGYQVGNFIPDNAYRLVEIYLTKGTYTISVSMKETINKLRWRKYRGTYEDYTESDKNISTFTITMEQDGYFEFQFRNVNTTETFTNLKIQIEQGSQATSYEEFTGGIPSPNPNYPQELKSVGDSGSFEVGVYGKNLIDINSCLPISSEKVTISGDNIIIEAKENLYGVWWEKPPLEVGQTYTFSVGAISQHGSEYGFRLGYENGTISSVPNGLIQTITITKPVSWANYYVGRPFSSTTDITISNVQVELGTQATPYEPCQKQSITLTDTLRGVGEVADEIDFAKGVLIQRINEVTLDGSNDEIWTIYGHRDDGTTRFDFKNTQTVGASSFYGCLCNGFKVATEINKGDDVCWTNNSESFLEFRIQTSRVSTVADLKAMLKANPIKVVYSMKTPIEIPLTETELNAYRQLHTNKPNTTIISEVEMQVDYVADPKTYIDNKFAELAALTLEV